MKRFLKTIKPKYARALIISAICIVALIAAYAAYNHINNRSNTLVSISLEPVEMIEAFKVVSYEITYETTIVLTEDIERKWLGLITLEPGVSISAFKYLSKISFGVDLGKDSQNLKVTKLGVSPDSGKIVYVLTIPKAEVLYHEAFLNDEYTIIADKSTHKEKADMPATLDAVIEAKKEALERHIEWGALDRAQKSAEDQLRNFLNAIPDFQKNFEFRFDVEGQS